MIAIVDYGMGNLRSVEQAVRNVASDTLVVVTDNATVISEASRVIFPGQGAMPDCMRELDQRNLRSAVVDAARSKPFLGICIGLQMLFDHSAEGDVPGLGLFRGKVSRFQNSLHDESGNRLKVPHMGWNQVHQSVPTHALWRDIKQDARFYFVHSYFVEPAEAGIVQATTLYPEPFVCAVARDNVFAVQFHPEKSHEAGLQLLRNFTNWKP